MTDLVERADLAKWEHLKQRVQFAPRGERKQREIDLRNFIRMDLKKAAKAAIKAARKEGVRNGR